MENHNFLSNNMLDSIRILILISKFSEKKYKLNMNKIMLYDYYMKYPSTMIESKKLSIDLKYNFQEYYSFYHWKPEIGNYRRVIQYLISKGLIRREIERKEFYYYISDVGLEIEKQLNSNYRTTLDVISDYVKDIISKKTEKEIEQEILFRTSILQRFEGDMNE